jgi:hypothetical protein
MNAFTRALDSVIEFLQNNVTPADLVLMTGMGIIIIVILWDRRKQLLKQRIKDMLIIARTDEDHCFRSNTVMTTIGSCPIQKMGSPGYRNLRWAAKKGATVVAHDGDGFWMAIKPGKSNRRWWFLSA